MKRILLMTLTVLLLAGYGFPIEDAGLLRMPDINGNLVVFVYAGDVWSVPADGGDARRLTSHQGMEIFPRISPDGEWIAFSAEYSGSRQVYVIPSAGGTPRQMTFYNSVGIMPPRGGFDHIVLDWTPDSKSILIRANRTPYGPRMGKYFLVDLEGGLEKPLQIPDAGFGSFSPCGKKIVYTPISREFRTWKRYRGGRAQDVWCYDLEKNTSRRITTFTGTDHHPIWYKDRIYFVSDRKLKLNFYSVDLKTLQEVRQITEHRDYDVLWPSGHDGRVVYENGGFIYKLNLDTGESKKLTVNLHFDNPHTLPTFSNVSKFVSRFGYHISPSGKRAVLDGRGDIFTVPRKEGITYNLTDSQGVREMYPTWSPDGKWIACYSDRTGDYEIYLLDPRKKEKPMQLTQDHRVWKYPAAWSPDSRMLLFSDKNLELQILDIKSKEIRVVDRGKFSGIRAYGWSPDSRWISYFKDGPNRLSTVWVYSLEAKKSYPVTDSRYDSFSPTFSACGRYLFFVSRRDFNMNFSSFEFDFVYHKASKIYAVALTPEAPDLFKEKNDVEGETAGEKEAEAEEKPGDKNKNKKEKKGKAGALLIDFGGIRKRVTVFPLGADDYGIIRDIDGKLLYLKGREVHLYDIDKKKDHLIIKDIRGVRLSADGKRLLYKAGDRYGIVDVKSGAARGASKSTAPLYKVGDGALELGDVTVKIDPIKEWRQIYHEGWRIFRDWFYVKNMHGVDWPAMREKYARLLPYVSHRADLDYIFGELVGELNAGHTYVNWGDFKKVERINTGLLGAQLEADEKSGRYIIEKIYEGENWNKNTRSPLTEPGILVKEGDFLIRLNEHDVTTGDNPYRFLENTAGKRISITVHSKPSPKGARTYWIKPIKSELGLFYLDWVNSRRRLVDKLSNGRIGYIHVPDTAMAGNRELFKGMYALSHKEALIVDERNNGGGWPPRVMIEFLSRRTVNYWHLRGLVPRPDPLFAVDGPKVMLINHYSSSGGDDFPYWFKKKKLGTLIGTRTWGGLIGYGWSPGLVDGPSFAVPMAGIVGTDGEWIVEGIGIYPDIEVYDRPEEIAKGRDPSIEKAVEVLLEKLEKNPPRPLTRKPPDPDRSKWHEKGNQIE